MRNGRRTIDAMSRKGIGPLLLLGFLILSSGLAGCRSTTEADNRPAWIRQAEARMEGEPEWKVRGQGARIVESRPFGGAGLSGAEHRRSSDGEASSKPPPTPPGARWGETKVTVEVEE